MKDLTIYKQLRDEKAQSFGQRVAYRAYFRGLMGRELSKGCRWHNDHEIKWQTMLRHEEAADLDAVRLLLFPGMSRYGLVRALLLMAIEVGKEVLHEKSDEK